MFSLLLLATQGVSLASQVTAEPSCPGHKILFPPLARAPERLVRAGRALRAVRAGRRLCDSGAAILSGRCWPRSSAPRSLPGRGSAADPGAPAHSSRRLRGRPEGRLGEERLSSALSSFSRPSSAAAPGSLCPPPSVGATSAGTRRRRLLLPPPPPLPPSPLPLSATISPLPCTGALS